MHSVEFMNGQQKAVLRLEGVTKRYGSFDAIKNLSLSVREGEFLTLLGPSGSGKSTILLLIAGFQLPTQGEIYVGERAMSGVPAHKRRLGIVFQNYALFGHLTVFENVAFALRNLRWNKADIDNRVDELLELVHLKAMADRLPSQLSGGQQQRIALARALAFRPSVLLLDEPLSALDKTLRNQMLLEFQRIHKTLGTTMIFVTHDQEEALAMSDRVAVVDRGEIVRLGTPQELYEDPRSSFVASFLGETNVLKGTVDDGGSIAVEGCGLTVRLDRSLPRGMAASIAIRPEKISIGQAEPDTNVARGRIADVLYLGSVTTYTVRLGSGHMLAVKQFNRFGTPTLQAGAEVELFWHPADCRLLDDENAPTPAREGF